MDKKDLKRKLGVTIVGETVVGDGQPQAASVCKKCNKEFAHSEIVYLEVSAGFFVLVFALGSVLGMALVKLLFK